MLPDSYRWVDSPQASYLYHNYRCVAVVTENIVKINRRGLGVVEGRCGSVAQGKRHVVRWMTAQPHFRRS